MQSPQRCRARLLVPSLISEVRRCEARDIPRRLASDDRSRAGAVVDEHRLVTGGVPWRGDDLDPWGYLVISVDLPEVDPSRERPLGNGVAACLGGFHLGVLDDDGGIGEARVLAAVVEVEVRGDHGRHLLDNDDVAVEGLVEIVVDRSVEPVDEGATDTDARVDDDRPARVEHQVREHRERRPSPWQRGRRRDIGEVEPVDLDHGVRAATSITALVAVGAFSTSVHIGGEHLDVGDVARRSGDAGVEGEQRGLQGLGQRDVDGVVCGEVLP